MRSEVAIALRIIVGALVVLLLLSVVADRIARPTVTNTIDEMCHP